MSPWSNRAFSERDREPEPGAAARARRIGLVEALEQVRKVFARNPGTAIGDLDERPEAVTANADCHLPAPVLESVPDQVGDDALDAPRGP